MSSRWAGSGRRLRLPPDWPHIRLRILQRDSWRCTAAGPDGCRCIQSATDVDHIVRGDDHRDLNLTSLCRDHHAMKSSREGNAARVRERRPKPKHPGLR